MTTHVIAPEHLDTLAQSEHVLQWLRNEQARLQLEMMTVAQQWQREEAKLRSLLSRAYGVVGDFTLDTKAGTVTVPEDPTPDLPVPVEESSDADRPE